MWLQVSLLWQQNFKSHVIKHQKLNYKTQLINNETDRCEYHINSYNSSWSQHNQLCHLLHYYMKHSGFWSELHISFCQHIPTRSADRRPKDKHCGSLSTEQVFSVDWTTATLERFIRTELDLLDPEHTGDITCGTPQVPPGGSGKHCWGEELYYLPELAAITAQLWVSGRRWMDGNTDVSSPRIHSQTLGSNSNLYKALKC